VPDLLTAAELAEAKEDLRILRTCGSRDPRLRFMERAIATIEALEAALADPMRAEHQRHIAAIKAAMDGTEEG